MNRRQLTLALTATAAAGIASPSLADDALKAAVASKHRSADAKVRDAHRRPYETLAFWGLKPRMRVLEVSPGGGYWTEILAPYAKSTRGEYIATHNPNPAAAQGVHTFKTRFSDEAKWGRPGYAPFGADIPLGAPASVDMVITARNIHNWMWTPGMLDKTFKNFHDVLKPGGILAVEEHRADPRPMVKEARDGYVDTAHVIAMAEKAGFKLEAKSEINANPKDTKDHPFGVWTLPPNRQGPRPGSAAPAGYSRANLDAIGESDRMTLRFRKV